MKKNGGMKVGRLLYRYRYFYRAQGEIIINYEMCHNLSSFNKTKKKSGWNLVVSSFLEGIHGSSDFPICHSCSFVFSSLKKLNSTRSHYCSDKFESQA